MANLTLRNGITLARLRRRVPEISLCSPTQLEKRSFYVAKNTGIASG
jgi:hypothetical protein